MKNVFGTSAPGSDDGTASSCSQCSQFQSRDCQHHWTCGLRYSRVSYSPMEEFLLMLWPTIRSTHHPSYPSLTLIYYHLFQNPAPQEGQNGIVIVVSCDEYHTYELNGPVAIYGSRRSPQSYIQWRSLLSSSRTTIPDYEHCRHEMFIYPTSKFKSSSESLDLPVVVPLSLQQLYFCSTTGRCGAYIPRLKRTHSNAIVSELFPAGAISS
jgi:hypothetical protein